MESTKQWYIVYTKAGQEQKVCEALRRKKRDSFYPVNKMSKLSAAGRARISFKPLLERYVFVFLSEEQVAETIKRTDGIISFVHWRSVPVVIDQDDIYLLKRYCKMHDDIELQKIKVEPAEPAFISTRFTNEDTELIHFHFPALGCLLTAKEGRTRVKIITVPEYQTKTTVSNQYAEAR